MLPEISVKCHDCDCKAAKTGRLLPGYSTPLRVLLDDTFDGLPIRYLYVLCKDLVVKYDISANTELIIPGSLFIPGEKVYVGVWARDEACSVVRPTVYALIGFVDNP